MSTPGGLYDVSWGDQRVGALDPAASLGQKATGYAVGGTGWSNAETPPGDLGKGYRIERARMDCVVALLRQLEAGRSNPSVSSRCGNLLPLASASADVRSLDDVIALKAGTAGLWAHRHRAQVAAAGCFCGLTVCT